MRGLHEAGDLPCGTNLHLLSRAPPNTTIERFPARSQALSLRLGCPPEDIAAQLMCLRNKSARAILDQTNKAKDFLFPSLVPTSAEVDNVPGRRFFIGTVSNEGSHMAQRVKSGTPKGGDLAEGVANWLDTRYGIAVSRHVIEAHRNASFVLDGGSGGDHWAQASVSFGNTFNQGFLDAWVTSA
ncbi:uncharacterized protein LOC144143142 [Haemaphysalis longicornis]